jgi:predicted enzyme related to lactoylglutathione lyase
MLTAVHNLIYADDPVAAREFFRDVLGYPTIDAGDGWLIFKLPPTELGVHPTAEGSAPSGTMRMSLMCEDLAATLDQLRAKGVVVLGEPVNAGYGMVATLKVPGGVELDVYEPRHPVAFDLG